MQKEEATSRVYALELLIKLRLQMWRAEARELTRQIRADGHHWQPLSARKRELADLISHAEEVLKENGL